MGGARMNSGSYMGNMRSPVCVESQLLTIEKPALLEADGFGLIAGLVGDYCLPVIKIKDLKDRVIGVPKNRFDHAAFSQDGGFNGFIMGKNYLSFHTHPGMVGA
jgi:hypothetical protein